MNSSDPSIDARLQLVKTNRVAIYTGLCRAVSRGHAIGDAVVVVADTTDAVGRKIANTAAMQVGASVDDELFQACDVTVRVIIVTMAVARSLLAKNFLRVADGLDRHPPSGCVRVVAIAAGAPMLVHSDVRPSAPIAEG